MTITRNDIDTVFDGHGHILSQTPVVRDVTLETNYAALHAAAQTALATNAAALALPDPTPANQTYLAIPTPTQAQAVAQVAALTQQVDALVAQVTALTRQNDALIRLALGLFDSTT